MILALRVCPLLRATRGRSSKSLSPNLSDKSSNSRLFSSALKPASSCSGSGSTMNDLIESRMRLDSSRNMLCRSVRRSSSRTAPYRAV